MAHRLNHTPPSCLSADDFHFYVTQCALPRGKNVLIPSARGLTDAIQHYHRIERWFCRAYVIMPDHLHLLISPYPGQALKDLMKQWKSYTARQLGIRWQQDFFEHRLRTEESTADKAYYMELNPVRAKLVDDPKEWKWFGYDLHTPSQGRDGLPDRGSCESL